LYIVVLPLVLFYIVVLPPVLFIVVLSPVLLYIIVALRQVLIIFVVLPPVLVPRYSEYPANPPPHSLLPYQQVQEPSMPHNVSYPHGFPQSPATANSPGPASPNSQYSNLPGMWNFTISAFN
jgi:hypothetical protein